MTIGFDITPLLFPGTGVAKYTYNLVKNLLLLDKKNKYKIFFVSLKSGENYPFLSEFKNLGAEIYHFKIPFKIIQLFWQKLNILPIEWFIGKVDIFYANDFLRSPSKIKTITTIHDLTWKIYPQYHTEEVIKAHKIKLEKTIKYGDEIIVDSENTKNDLLKYYPQINKNKVHVIYPGVDERFKKLKINPPAGKEKLKIVFKKYLKNTNQPITNHQSPTTNYLLYVGAIEPRKNLETAIKVFHKLLTTNHQPPDTRHQPPTTNHQSPITNHQPPATHFLIIGRAGWKNEKIFSLVKELKLEDKVLFLGYVEDDDLPYFYSNALATIYLSKYEGFGIPPLESAYCQTPVLLYKNSSLKELFNDKYPYAEKGRELETLIYLIKNKVNPKKYLKTDFSYKKTAEEFLKTLKNL